METGHTISKHGKSSFLSKVLITKEEFNGYVHDMDCSSVDNRRYVGAYNEASVKATRTIRSLNVMRRDPGAKLTAIGIDNVIKSNAPNPKWVGLDCRFYLTLITRSSVQPIRLTKGEIFIFGRLFERQDQWPTIVGSPSVQKVVEEASESYDLLVSTYSFLSNDIVESSAKRFDDGQLMSISTNMVMERDVYDTLCEFEKYPHWRDFIRATETSILVVG